MVTKSDTQWTAIAKGADGETVAVTWHQDGVPDKETVATLLLQKVQPGRLVPSNPQGATRVELLLSYGFEIVSVEPDPEGA